MGKRKGERAGEDGVGKDGCWSRRGEKEEGEDSLCWLRQFHSSLMFLVSSKQEEKHPSKLIMTPRGQEASRQALLEGDKAGRETEISPTLTVVNEMRR